MLSPYRTSDTEKRVIKAGIIIGSCLLGIIMLSVVSLSLFVIDFREKLKPDSFNIPIIASVCLMLLPSFFPLIRKLRFKDLEVEMKPEGQFSVTTSILQEFDFYLDNEKVLSKDDIRKLVRMLDYTHIDLLFQFINNWRTQKVFRLMNLAGFDSQFHTAIRKEIGKLVDILEELLLAANNVNNEMHPYYAILAYVYKDKFEPNYVKAYLNISKAIEIAGKRNIRYGIYYFNRLICSINIRNKHKSKLPQELAEYSKNFEANIVGDYDAVNGDINARQMLYETSECIAPGLAEYIKSRGK